MEKSMRKFLLIGGASGSGKSYVERKLYQENIEPEIEFNRLYQYTTRDMREGEVDGDSYFFINKEKYNEIKDELIAKTNFYGNYYGTMDTSKESTKDLIVINTIVVSAEGMLNAEKDIIDKYGKDNIDVLKLMITSDDLENRKDRDVEGIDKEIKDLKEASEYSIDNSENNRITTSSMINFLKEINYL